MNSEARVTIDNLDEHLPDRMSDLLDFAISSLEEFEARDGYEVDMEHWLTPSDPDDDLSPCLACLAGAAAIEAGIDQQIEIDVNGSTKPTSKMNAIDMMRLGNIEDAAQIFGVDGDVLSCMDRRMAHYENKRFYPDLRQLAADLRKEGL